MNLVLHQLTKPLVPPNQAAEPAIDIMGGQGVVNELERIEGLANTGAGLSNVIAMRGYLQRVESRIRGLPRSDLVRLNRAEIVLMLERGTRRERVLRVVNKIRGRTSELLGPIGSLDQSDLSRLLQGYRDTIQDILKRVNQEPVIPLRHGETRAANDDMADLLTHAFDGTLNRDSVEIEAIFNRIKEYHPTQAELRAIRDTIINGSGPRSAVTNHTSKPKDQIETEITNFRNQIKQRERNIRVLEGQIKVLEKAGEPRTVTVGGVATVQAETAAERTARINQMNGIYGQISNEESHKDNYEAEIKDREDAIAHLESGGTKETHYDSPVEMYSAIVMQLAGNPRRNISMTEKKAIEMFQEDVRAIENPEDTKWNTARKAWKPTLSQVFDTAGEAWVNPDTILHKLGKEKLDALISASDNPHHLREWIGSLEGSKDIVNGIIGHMIATVNVARRKGLKLSSSSKAEKLEKNLTDMFIEKLEKEVKEDNPDADKNTVKKMAITQWRKIINEHKPDIEANYKRWSGARKMTSRTGSGIKWGFGKGLKLGKWIKNKVGEKIEKHKDSIKAGFRTTGDVLGKGAVTAKDLWVAAASGGAIPLYRLLRGRGFWGKKGKIKPPKSKTKSRDLEAKPAVKKETTPPPKVEKPEAPKPQEPPKTEEDNVTSISKNKPSKTTNTENTAAAA